MLSIQPTSFLATLSPASSSIPSCASHQASLLIQHLPDSEAQDRVALHTVLRVGPSGDGVRVAYSILSLSSTERDETSYVALSQTQRCFRIWLCAGLLKGMTKYVSSTCVQRASVETNDLHEGRSRSSRYLAFSVCLDWTLRSM
jgi:hypothetical protein